MLDTAVTPELEAEGVARDLVRAVQDARKAAGLEVGDRIRLELRLDEAGTAAAERHRELIAGETLATAVELRPLPAGSTAKPLAGGTVVEIGVERA
jgi:isoleucyl-tRNA synthetase